MIVCHCHRVTDRDIAAAASCGAADEAELARHCGAGTSCGGCRPALRGLLELHRKKTVALATAADTAEG